MPSAIFYTHKPSLIPNPILINPNALIQQINYIHHNHFTTNNLSITQPPHIILPYHILFHPLQQHTKPPNK
ncbi:adenylosuccinate synthetase, partial [Paenibacillus xylanexedens]|uniref:adenylosuccinate synthetase n=1 Tax=Paenibacillus xylanexedens TaxID=528191 RepID=UPI0034D9552A